MGPWLTWQLDSDLLAVLSVLWVSYAVCWVWLRRADNRHRAASVGHLISWTLGLLAIAVATMSAVDSMADQFFYVHMIQHMLLMYAAPPLLLFGRPLSIWTVAFSRRSRGPATESFPFQNALANGVGFFLEPRVAWALSIIVLVAWHVPAAYDYALLHPAVHEYVEHTSMFLAYLAWWHPLIGSIPRFPHLTSSKSRFIYLGANWVPSMLLGMVILYWPTVLYTYYLSVPHTGGISAMLDQQLGALVMMSGCWAVLFVVAVPLQYRDNLPQNGSAYVQARDQGVKQDGLPAEGRTVPPGEDETTKLS